MPGIFEGNKHRLDRLRPGATTDELIEELLTLLSEDKPLEASSGLKVDSPAEGQSPIEIGEIADGDTPIIRGTRPNGDTYSFTINDIVQVTQQLKMQKVVQTAQVFPGKLTFYFGSNVYGVSIYPNGLDKTSESVRVTQLQGDDTIPHAVDGSVWAIVTKLSSDYTMQVPVWG